MPRSVIRTHPNKTLTFSQKRGTRSRCSRTLHKVRRTKKVTPPSDGQGDRNDFPEERALSNAELKGFFCRFARSRSSLRRGYRTRPLSHHRRATRRVPPHHSVCAL